MWPDKKKFAFTVIDDTDNSTLDNAPIIYDYLISKGIYTTKSVWVRNGEEGDIYSSVNGDTLSNRQYFDWVKDIQSRGIEICLHSMSWSSSKRGDVLEGFDFFEKNIGKSQVLVQHNDIKENESIYWGSKRLVFPLNIFFEIMVYFNPKGVNSNIYQGEIESSKYFWGDICKEKVRYVRNLVFPEINLFRITKKILHIRKSTKYVNRWFLSSEAPDIESFVKILSKKNIDRLESENGICIIYTHFGNGFVKDRVLDDRFKNAIDYLSSKDGWFVPASDIFKHLEKDKSIDLRLNYYEEFILGFRWLFWKLFRGTS